MSYNFFHKTLLGKILKPFYQFWFNYERNFQRSILLQQGLVNTLLCRHSKINIYIMMLNLEDKSYLNISQEKVFTLTIGFSRQEEEKDIIVFKEVIVDFSYHNLFKTKLKLKLIEIIEDYSMNGLHSLTTTIGQILHQLQEEQSFQFYLHLI